MIDARWQPMQTRVNTSGKRRKSPFGARHVTVMDDLERELRALGAEEIVIEGGFQLQHIRNDGWPRSSASASHPDIRLNFNGKHGAMSFSCGTYMKWEDNLRAIGLVMQDLRLMAEKGVGTGTEQYRGWTALPPAGGIQMAEWGTAEEAAREIVTLGMEDGRVPSDFDVRTAISNPATLREWFKNAAKRCHPDTGGSDAQMARLNRARDFIEKARGG